MQRFGTRRPLQPGDVSVSIKLRVVSGCFHREHSPHAYAAIDAHLARTPTDIEFAEHESGPELLVYLAVATAGITLAKSVIDLITAILKARTDGVKKGDKPAAPLELIVRRVNDGREFQEEIVFRLGHSQPVDPRVVEKAVDEALRKFLKNFPSSEE